MLPLRRREPAEFLVPADLALLNKRRAAARKIAEEPLDPLGWDEFGSFICGAEHRERVDAHVKMYGLERLKGERAKMVTVLRTFLAYASMEEPVKETTRAGLARCLAPTSGFLGPVREYLLRPPSPADQQILDEALRRLPELRTWVSPWLRPPTWAHAGWRGG